MNDVKTIYLTKGVPASGKSTWAREQIMKRPGQIKRFNKDDMRSMIDDGNFTLKNERFIVDMRNRMVEAALLRGYDVIVDDTNFNDKHWNYMCDIAKRVGNVRVVEVFFSVSLKEAISRNENRENPVPEHVVTKMFNKHVSGSNIEKRDEYFIKVNSVWDNHSSILPPAIIVDLDGTLAINNSGRDYYDYSRVIEDDVNEAVKSAILAYDAYWQYCVDGSCGKRGNIIIMSGREDYCMEDTRVWLGANNIPHDYMYMREEGDRRKDNIVKTELYEKHIKGEFNVLFAMDDRTQVVNVWRTLGIPTFQVDNGDF